MPVSNDWNTAANWTPATVPSSGGSAAFGASSVTDISLSGTIDLDRLTFGASAPAYTIHTNGHLLYLYEAGVVNDSAAKPTFDVNGGIMLFFAGTAANATFTTSLAGSLNFYNGSTADHANITVLSGGTASLIIRNNATAAQSTILNQGLTQFIEAATAGSATITNEGELSFFTTSTAGDATITTRSGARTSFVEQSSGGNGRFVTELGGRFSLDNLATAGTTTGSIAGAGTYSLGAKNLTTGGNDDTTEVSGPITGDGGSLTKVGTGTLTLNGNNSYSGGTTVSKGVLAVMNNGSMGTTTSGLMLQGGGMLRLLSSFDSARPVSIPDTGSIDTNGFNSTFAGQISGAGGLNKFGAGMLTLTNNNIQKFGTFIAGGTVQIFSDTNLGDPAGPLGFDGGTLRLLADVTTNRYGSVTYGGGIIDTNGFNLVHNGVLFGVTGGLTKIGAGILTLNAASQYTGVTRVLGGSLLLNGSVAGDVEVGTAPATLARQAAAAPVAAAPIFGGTGTVGGSLRNFTGIVSPGNSPGALRINQDFMQGPQGTLRIEIAGRDDASFDHLLVRRNAFLDGTVRFVTLNNFRPARGGDRFVFLTAAAGLTGTFSSVVLDAPLLGGRVVYTATTAELDVARRPILSLFAGGNGNGDLAPAPRPEPLTPNQTAVAKSLDRGIDDHRLMHLFDQLDRYPARSLPAALDLIAPDELSAIYEIGIGTANVQAFNLDRHLSDLRAGARGFSAGRLSLTGVAAGPGQGALALDGKDDPKKEVFAPTEENRWNTFVSGSGEFTNIHGDGNSPDGYDITTGGFTVGATYRVAEGFAVGGFLGYAGTGADLAGDGRILVNSGKLGLYATLYNDAAYLNLMAAGGLNSYDLKRESLGGVTHGETEGGEFSALLSGGYDFHARAFSLGPFAEAAFTRVAYDGYRERGSAAPLDIAGNDSDSLRTRLGARLAWQSGKPSARWQVRPELRVAWQREWADNTRPTDATFASGGGTEFRVEGPHEGRDALVVNASVSFACTERFSTYLAYDATLARTRYDSQTVSGGVRWSF